MANTSMNIRMDADIKKQAQSIFAELGMDMTTAVNVFLRQAIRYHGFPFEVRLDEPNNITTEAIENSSKNKNISGPFSSVDELMEDLNA